MQEPRYLDDERYPGPSTHPPPAHITGLPTQAELDAYPRMFTWGELKGIIQSGDLEQLMRNKQMQAKYNIWSAEIKREYGSTEAYLTRARLPWAQSTPRTPQPTYPDEPPSRAPADVKQAGSSLAPPSSLPSGRSALASGTSTPSSAGFVSMDDLQELLVKHKARKAEKANGEVDADPLPDFLRYDPESGLDSSRYAVLFNDWPYNTPYGVRHYCVWSRVPIAHPHLVDYDRTKWARIESEGLGGFTGVTPTSFDIFGDGTSQSSPRDASSTPPSLPVPLNRTIPPKKKDEWYAVDCAFGGPELRRWAGVEYQSTGADEVARMVRSLWDERGWECLFFVNPPRLQSVPGFSHFHVFARRKTPEEIDASEAVWGEAD